MKKIGIIILVVGLVGLAIALGLDTSVASGYRGERVHNIGLMNEKQSYLIVAIALSVVGAFVLAIGFRSDGQRLLAETGSGPTRACPYCAEQIKSQAVLCRFCGKDVEPFIDKSVAETEAVTITNKGVENRSSGQAPSKLIVAFLSACSFPKSVLILLGYVVFCTLGNIVVLPASYFTSPWFIVSGLTTIGLVGVIVAFAFGLISAKWPIYLVALFSIVEVVSVLCAKEMTSTIFYFGVNTFLEKPELFLWFGHLDGLPVSIFIDFYTRLNIESKRIISIASAIAPLILCGLLIYIDRKAEDQGVNLKLWEARNLKSAVTALGKHKIRYIAVGIIALIILFSIRFAYELYIDTLFYKLCIKSSSITDSEAVNKLRCRNAANRLSTSEKSMAIKISGFYSSTEK